MVENEPIARLGCFRASCQGMTGKARFGVAVLVCFSEEDLCSYPPPKVLAQGWKAVREVLKKDFAEYEELQASFRVF